MAMRGYVAFDLGAESGRAMLATLNQGKLKLQEAHRFANRPVRLPSGYHWDLTGLWAHLVEGLAKAGCLAREQNVELVSLGVDTWGVDFGLLGASGQLLELPLAYRDESHAPAMAKAIDQLGQPAIYNATGIQFLPFNTLFQLIARKNAQPQLLDLAQRMLNIPDLLHYFFSGTMTHEATIASTTQMVDPRTGQWDRKLLQQLGLPHHFLHDIVPAGTNIGTLRDEIANPANVPAMDVIVPGSHDTASAIAAVPVAPDVANWAYLSSGTWSLMGAELDAPLVTEAARNAAFTNERGVGDKIRFLTNIAGLWLVQQVRADLSAKGQAYDYPALTQYASEAQPFRTLLDPGHEPLASPGDFCAKINAFADHTGQPQPQTPGQYVRCCLESLALTYKRVLRSLDELLGRRTQVLHIVGGGGKNELLDQMTADAVGIPTLVGPYEGTAIGNALTQAIGAGDVKDLAQLRHIVRHSFDIKTFQPQQAQTFDAVYDRFLALL